MTVDPQAVPNQVAASMEQQDFQLTASDGKLLLGYHWPCPEPKAVVQIVHGMAEHVRRYARLAAALVDNGYAVYGHDQRGHGRTAADGTLGHMADRDGWTRIVLDAHEVNREIASRHPGLPLIILGHSMGSFVLQQLLYEHPRDMAAAVLSSSNGKPPPLVHIGRVVARAERLRLGKDKSSPVLQEMSFGAYNKAFAPVRTESDWLSRDPAEVDAYVADPWCGFPVTTQCWADMLDALPKLAHPANVSKVRHDVPIYLFAGNLDPVGDQGQGVRRLREQYLSAGLTDVTLKLYPRGRHEMLNETNRQEVFADLITWCDGALERAGR